MSNKTRHSLARIPLRWMIRECFKAKTGIMFCSDKLRGIGMDPSTLYPYVKDRPPPLAVKEHRIQNPPAKPIPIRTHRYLTKKHHPDVYKKLVEHAVPFLGSEEEEELRDAISPKYDQLKLKMSWWVLELVPLKLRYQRADDEWVTTWGYVLILLYWVNKTILTSPFFKNRINRANPRYIPQQRTNGFKVHRSVKMRMEAEYEDEQRRQKGKRYIPKPIFKVTPDWVD